MNLPALLPISPENDQKVKKTIAMYKKMGVSIEPVSFEDNILTVQVEQKKYLNDKIFTDRELEDRGKEVFSDKLPYYVKIAVSPVFSSQEDLNSIDSDYIKVKMKELSLKPANVCKYLNIDKTAMDSVLEENAILTNWQKAAFYYFFKHYNLKIAVNYK